MKNIILIFLTLFFISCDREVVVEEVKEPIKEVHDTMYPPVEISSEQLESGKDIFRKNCACCHSFDRDVVGPRLVYRNDYEFLFHRKRPDYMGLYIMNSDSLYAAGDEWVKKMRKDYPMNRMIQFKEVLTKKECEDVVAFINYRTTHQPCVH